MKWELDGHVAYVDGHPNSESAHLWGDSPTILPPPPWLRAILTGQGAVLFPISVRILTAERQARGPA